MKLALTTSSKVVPAIYPREGYKHIIRLVDEIADDLFYAGVEKFIVELNAIEWLFIRDYFNLRSQPEKVTRTKEYKKMYQHPCYDTIWFAWDERLGSGYETTIS